MNIEIVAPKKLVYKHINDFYNSVQEHIEDTDQKTIVIDLINVEEIDSAGLQLLMHFKTVLQKNLKLRNHSNNVIKIFNLFGVFGFLGDKVILTRETPKLEYSYGLRKSDYR